MLFLRGWTDFLGVLERRHHDLASTRSWHQPSERMANSRRWPRPRDVQASLMLPQFYPGREGRPLLALSLSRHPAVRCQPRRPLIAGTR